MMKNLVFGMFMALGALLMHQSAQAQLVTNHTCKDIEVVVRYHVTSGLCMAPGPCMQYDFQAALIPANGQHTFNSTCSDGRVYRIEANEQSGPFAAIWDLCTPSNNTPAPLTSPCGTNFSFQVLQSGAGFDLAY